MHGEEAAAVLLRQVRKMENESVPFPSAEDEALRDALEAGIKALRLMSQWEEFIVMEEGED